MSDAWDREMEAVRRARRLEAELRGALEVMPDVVQGIAQLDYEYGSPDLADEFENLLERLEPIASRIIQLSKRLG